MLRTQISLSVEEYSLAKREAKRQGISLAEYFRRALRAALPRRSDKPWTQYSGMVNSGNPRASQEIDEVVYGREA